MVECISVSVYADVNAWEERQLELRGDPGPSYMRLATAKGLAKITLGLTFPMGKRGRRRLVGSFFHLNIKSLACWVAPLQAWSDSI